MSDRQVNDLMGITMEKVKSMVDVNTVMGTPITTPDGTTVIPVSKVSYGFAGGGSDLPSKAKAEGQNGSQMFLGGSGAGITVQPVAFLAVSNGNVKVIQIEPYTSSVDRAIEKVPDVMDKVTSFVDKVIKSDKSDKTEKVEKTGE
jgi:sporulation protein YtfJ